MHTVSTFTQACIDFDTAVRNHRRQGNSKAATNLLANRSRWVKRRQTELEIPKKVQTALSILRAGINQYKNAARAAEEGQMGRVSV